MIPFGRRLKNVRELYHLDQVDFAKMLHLKYRQNISFIESGKMGVTFSRINYIAKRLDLLSVGFYYYDNKKK